MTMTLTMTVESVLRSEKLITDQGQFGNLVEDERSPLGATAKQQPAKTRKKIMCVLWVQ
jgi:hypothetical protein